MTPNVVFGYTQHVYIRHLNLFLKLVFIQLPSQIMMHLYVL